LISSGQKYSLAAQQHNFVATKATDNFQNQAKKLPCHVKTVNNDDTVVVTFDIQSDVFTLPDATYPQAFSKYSREPTQVGDKGYIVPNDVNLGGESGLGGGVANLFQRGNLTTGVFHPISNTNNPKRDQNQFLVTGGPSGHKTQTQDTKTYHLLDALNNIIHNSSANIAHTALNNLLHTVTQGIMSHVSPQIQQIASQALTIANTGDMINLVSKHFTVGAPSSEFVLETFADDSTTPPTPPTPSAQTIFNVIGSILASGNISAGGMISAAGFGGATGGDFPIAGSSGEIIYDNITTGETITNNVPASVASIQLTPGVWQVQGEVWFIPTAGFTAIYSAIGPINATFPTAPSIATARSQIVFSANTPSNAEQILSLRPCYVNITANTTYYLIAQAAFGGACTVMGNIWAVRI
jgi:hypothetical protein